VDLPPVPELPARPALPVVPEIAEADLILDLDATMPVPDFEAIPLPDIPPPPVTATADAVPGFEDFVPYSVAPELRNRQQVARALRARYPAFLQSAGIGGEVLFWFWIDEDGVVQHHEIKQSSGRKELDEAALEVVELMRFSPALDRGKPVRIIVALPIRFEVR
jgi:protein TonB